MQELAILLSSIAGAASAVAVRRLPRGAAKLQSIGASAHVKNQVSSLKIEKDVLNKTIARLYEDTGLQQIQKDRLLLRYQHQLGIVLARLERMEVASRHPDLGPVGDGLITLMDQKLSQLDSRLYELSSRISAGAKTGDEAPKKAGGPVPSNKTEKAGPAAVQNPPSAKIEVPRTKREPMEITTLTSIPSGTPRYPLEEAAQAGRAQEAPRRPDLPTLAGIAQVGPAKDPEKTAVLPAPRDLPEQEGSDARDEEDLEKIKGDLLKTLSKLEQAEVE